MDYRSSESTLCGAWLACASIAVPDCDRICSRVKFTISDATSTSRIRDSDADRFSWVTPRLAIADSSRFWTAPRFERTDETELMAVSICDTSIEMPENESAAIETP